MSSWLVREPLTVTPDTSVARAVATRASTKSSAAYVPRAGEDNARIAAAHRRRSRGLLLLHHVQSDCTVGKSMNVVKTSTTRSRHQERGTMFDHRWAYLPNVAWRP